MKHFKFLLVVMAMSILSIAASAQSKRTITGRVLDSQETPIPGATVMLDGGKSGVVTDVDGNFILETAAGQSVKLDISGVGYVTQHITVSPSQGTVTVTLEESTSDLEDVVVVGYGSQKKVNLTGAVSTVGSKDLKNRAVVNVGQMLQGVVPGLNVTSSSGRPGQTSTLNIRGTNSINGGSPLVLIDGVEGNIDKINPADVESISIIKDASSAAIYGARASAGVILVTTKSGSDTNGKVNVHYSGRFGVTSPTASTDWETRGYYSVLINNQFFNAYAGKPYATYTDDDMAELWARVNDETEDPSRPWVVVTENAKGQKEYNYYCNTDWWHYLYRDNKPMTTHNISFSGGTKKFKYALSGDYNWQKGMLKQCPDVYQKYDLRSKMSFEVNKYISISNNTSFYRSDYDYSGRSGVNTSFSNPTVHGLASYPTSNPDGSGVYTTKYNGYQVMDGYAAVINNNKHYNRDQNNTFGTTTEITFTPIKQLEVKANYTYQNNHTQNTNQSVNVPYSKVPDQIINLTTGVGENYLQEKNEDITYQSTNVFATYTDNFANAHNIKVTAGINYETYGVKDVTAKGWNLVSEDLHDLNLVGAGSDGTVKTSVSGGHYEYATLGYFGRINYDYKEKYLFEASGRYDGTSRFAAGSRWGFFPSASVGWKMSGEDFWKPVEDWWNFAKIRYSYGSLGNQQVGYYDYLRTITLSTQSYLFGGSKPTAATLSAPVSSTLTWEKSLQHNIGIDLAFLNNRLSFTAEGYIRDTKDMLTAGIALPAAYGADSPKMNSADMRTKGYELQLTWKDNFQLAGKPFEYSVTASFSDYTSKITKYNNDEKSFAKTYYEGMTVGEIWGFHVLGLFQSDEEAAEYTSKVDQTYLNYRVEGVAASENGWKGGDMKFADLDGDGKISLGKNTANDSGDRKVIGNTLPRFNYGLNLGARWNGFDFQIFFQGVGRMNWYPSNEARWFWGPYCRPYATFIPKDFQNMIWTEDNKDAYFPRARGYISLSSTNGCLGVANDRYMQNIAYCRLKNLSFGYTIPSKITKKAKMEEVRIYVTGENLYYWSPFKKVSKYFDPEACQASTTLNVYPWQKTFVVGLDVTF